MSISPGRRRTFRDKIRSLRALLPLVRQAGNEGKRAVFTNGCFDLLHPGHVDLLERARSLGDLLIVGVNSDRSVRALKGSSRPIVAQRDRAVLVAALESVDYVTLFDAPTPRDLIKRLKPHILVKGADWGADEIIGREIVQQSGGRVARLRLCPGYSTTRLIERIQRGDPSGA